MSARTNANGRSRLLRRLLQGVVAAALGGGLISGAVAATGSSPASAPASAGTGAAPASAAASAGIPPAGVTFDPPEPRIGDRVMMAVTTEGPEPWSAKAPESPKAGDDLGSFKVLGVDVSGPRTFVLWLTPNGTGALEVPEMTVTFTSPAGASRMVKVPTSRLTVPSALGEGDATLADLKPPVDLPVPWPWRLIALVTLAAAAAAAAAWWLVRRARRPRLARPGPELALPPGVTPDAWVTAALEALLARGLVEAGQIREFHIELADLIRRYLELRYRIPALERTTGEVRDEMERALLGGPALDATEATLSSCDQVKFAKHLPMAAEIAGTIAMARRVVALTRPPAEPVQAPAAAGTDGAGSGGGSSPSAGGHPPEVAASLSGRMPAEEGVAGPGSAPPSALAGGIPETQA